MKNFFRKVRHWLIRKLGGCITDNSPPFVRLLTDVPLKRYIVQRTFSSMASVPENIIERELYRQITDILPEVCNFSREEKNGYVTYYLRLYAADIKDVEI